MKEQNGFLEGAGGGRETERQRHREEIGGAGRMVWSQSGQGMGGGGSGGSRGGTGE